MSVQAGGPSLEVSRQRLRLDFASLAPSLSQRGVPRARGCEMIRGEWVQKCGSGVAMRQPMSASGIPAIRASFADRLQHAHAKHASEILPSNLFSTIIHSCTR